MAKSRSIGGAYATLSLRDLKFRKGLKSARAGLNKFGSAAIKAGGVAAAAITAGMVAGTKRAITMGAELHHLASQTGLAVDEQMILRQAFKDSGISADNAKLSINKMQKSIIDASQGSTRYIEALDSMGLSTEDLLKKSTFDQFIAVGEAINRITDPAKRAHAAMRIFGRAGAELQTVFQDTRLEDVRESLGKMPGVMKEISAELERADTLIGRLPNKSDQFFAGFTSGIIHQILPGLEAVNDTDFTDIGEELGLKLAHGLEIITSGKAWELFTLHAQKAIETIRSSMSVNFLAAGANTGGDFLSFLFKDDQLGFDFKDTFSKYADAGIAANIEIIDDIQAKIDKINLDSATSVGDKRGDNDGLFTRAAKRGIKTFEAFQKMQNNAGNLPFEKASEAKAAKAAVIAMERPSMEIGDFQRRGLSMSRDPSTIQDKALKIQQEIRDILKNAKVQGKELIWT